MPRNFDNLTVLVLQDRNSFGQLSCVKKVLIRVMATTHEAQYDAYATGYNSMDHLPLLVLEADLIKTALGDCKRARVLDLGGGGAKHARAAVAAGAEIVDLIDISDEMMNAGREIEARSNEPSRINFVLADVSKPLDHLGLAKQSYDIVMANWVFDSGPTLEGLEGMWHNIATYIKPGGKFIGARCGSLENETARSGKYGLMIKDVRPIPNGVAYQVICQLDPPFAFEGTSLDTSASGSTEMHEKYGFTQIQTTFGKDSDIVKQDPEYWAMLVNDQLMVVVTAVKA